MHLGRRDLTLADVIAVAHDAVARRKGGSTVRVRTRRRIAARRGGAQQDAEWVEAAHGLGDG